LFADCPSLLLSDDTSGLLNEVTANTAHRHSVGRRHPIDAPSAVAASTSNASPTNRLHRSPLLAPFARHLAQLGASVATGSGDGSGKLLVLTVCGSGTIPYLRPWVQMLKAHGHSNYVVVAQDREAARHCEKQRPRIFCVPWPGAAALAAEPSLAGVGREWLVLYATAVLLEAQLSVVASGMGVLWLRDPLVVLRQRRQRRRVGSGSGSDSDFDLEVSVPGRHARRPQLNEPPLGAGFYAARASDGTRSLFEALLVAAPTAAASVGVGGSGDAPQATQATQSTQATQATQEAEEGRATAGGAFDVLLRGDADSRPPVAWEQLPAEVFACLGASGGGGGGGAGSGAAGGGGDGKRDGLTTVHAVSFPQRHPPAPFLAAFYGRVNASFLDHGGARVPTLAELRREGVELVLEEEASRRLLSSSADEVEVEQEGAAVAPPAQASLTNAAGNAAADSSGAGAPPPPTSISSTSASSRGEREKEKEKKKEEREQEQGPEQEQEKEPEEACGEDDDGQWVCSSILADEEGT
jgi:hypothetical protein